MVQTKLSPAWEKGDEFSIPGLPDVLGHRMGFVLSKAARQLKAAFEDGLAPLGIRPRHYSVLVLLTEVGPLSQQEIGQKLFIDRTTMVHIIDDLEERGLVIRDKNPNDRRMYAVNVTDAAREVLSKAYNVSVAVEKRFLAPLDAAEHRQLHRILKKLVSPA